jgi:hypothetical protein
MCAFFKYICFFSEKKYMFVVKKKLCNKLYDKKKVAIINPFYLKYVLEQ